MTPTHVISFNYVIFSNNYLCQCVCVSVMSGVHVYAS